jgi:hypothetical protein
MSTATGHGRREVAAKLLGIAIAFVLAFACHVDCAAQEQPANDSAAKILEQELAFPQPIEWRQGDVELYLVGLAWGPANSPEMIAKGHEARVKAPPEFFADRPYALALHIQAKKGKPNEIVNASGLVRVTDVTGHTENPWTLTPSGFVQPLGFPGASAYPPTIDSPPEFWHFFPASEQQKEFLFQVIWPAGVNVSFRVLVKPDKLVVVNSSPGAALAPLQFKKRFAGTVGSETQVYLQLTANGSELSGTEQYARIGKTLWLKGALDSLGNFVMKEYYPRDQETGIFDGKFTGNYVLMNGYFSKPDGSRLQPFQFQEATPTSRTNRDKDEDEN